MRATGRTIGISAESIWVHYGATKIGRGELFEALDFLSFVRGQVLGPLGLKRAGARPAGVRKIERARSRDPRPEGSCGSTLTPGFYEAFARDVFDDPPVGTRRPPVPHVLLGEDASCMGAFAVKENLVPY